MANYGEGGNRRANLKEDERGVLNGFEDQLLQHAAFMLRLEEAFHGDDRFTQWLTRANPIFERIEGREMETIADLYEFIQITTAGPRRPGEQMFHKYVQLPENDLKIAQQGIRYLHAYLLKFNLGKFFNLIPEEEKVLFYNTLKPFGL